MIRPLPDRILVKLIDRYVGETNKLNLVLVDKKRHYEGIRRGVVQNLGKYIRDVSVGDVVYFRGDSGESFGMEGENANDGTEWRRLRMSDLLAVEEPMPEKVLQEAL